MLSIETLVTFLSASFLIGIAPGPDNLFVLTVSAANGKRAGVWVTFGLCTGLLGHTAAVVLGVAAVLQASPIAFTALQLIGAGYLAYLAWGAFRSNPRSLDGELGQTKLDAWHLYRRGIVMNITNPKVSMFFLAFLPQFVDSSQEGTTMQILFLGALFMLMTLIVFGGVALLAGQLGAFFRRSPRSQVVMNRVAGVVFLALATKLLLDSVG